MKYLKVYMGKVTGSLSGRDDGYPIQKTAIINSKEQLIKTFDENADYYELTPAQLDIDELMYTRDLMNGKLPNDILGKTVAIVGCQSGIDTTGKVGVVKSFSADKTYNYEIDFGNGFVGYYKFASIHLLNEEL